MTPCFLINISSPPSPLPLSLLIFLLKQSRGDTPMKRNPACPSWFPPPPVPPCALPEASWVPSRAGNSSRVKGMSKQEVPGTRAWPGAGWAPVGLCIGDAVGAEGECVVGSEVCREMRLWSQDTEVPEAGEWRGQSYVLIRVHADQEEATQRQTQWPDPATPQGALGGGCPSPTGQGWSWFRRLGDLLWGPASCPSSSCPGPLPLRAGFTLGGS